MDRNHDGNGVEILMSLRGEYAKKEDPARTRQMSQLTEKMILQISRTLLSNNLEAAVALLDAAKGFEQAAAYTLEAQDVAAAYQLGRLGGAYIALQPFISDQAEEEELNNARNYAPKYFDRILNYLGDRGKESPGNLAEALRVSPPNLSNILRRMSNAGVVYSEKAGKFHYYYLTPVGRKYWQKQHADHDDDKAYIETLFQRKDDVDSEEDWTRDLLYQEDYRGICGKEQDAEIEESSLIL